VPKDNKKIIQSKFRINIKANQMRINIQEFNMDKEKRGLSPFKFFLKLFFLLFNQSKNMYLLVRAYPQHIGASCIRT
jgi:hypothetical protein